MFINYSRFFLSIFFGFCFFLSLSAQQSDKSPEKDKTKEQTELEEKAYKLLSKTIDEAAALKLGENRILVSGIAGSLLWKKDEKLSRQIIRSVAAEFAALQNLPNYRFKNDEPNYQFYILNNLRGQIIFNLLQKDAAFALEILQTTRPSELAEAVQAYRQIVAETGGNPNFSELKSPESNRLRSAQFEIEGEERIKREIIKNDPTKLAESIREAFAKDLSAYQIPNDLYELNKMDHELAQKILNEILNKLASVEFSDNSGKNTMTFFIYGSFLRAKKDGKIPKKTSNEKVENLEFDEKLVQAVAANEIEYFSKENAPINDGNFIQKAVYLKQILPDRFRQIEKKYKAVKKSSYGEYAESIEASEKLGENPTLEQIIEVLPKINTSRKENYFRTAIGKLLETESPEKIAAKLELIADAKDKENALNHLKSLAAKKIGERNELSEAIKAINEIKSDNERTGALIELAIFYNRKNTEDSRKTAGDLMNEARKSIKEIPETAAEYEAILPLIFGYAQIDPAKAFEMTGAIIRQSNEIIEAYVIYSNYADRNYPYVREKEIIFPAQDTYVSYKSKYGAIIKMLAQNDFERLENLTNNFQRQDVRILTKLLLAESILTQPNISI